MSWLGQMIPGCATHFLFSPISNCQMDGLKDAVRNANSLGLSSRWLSPHSSQRKHSNREAWVFVIRVTAVQRKSKCPEPMSEAPRASPTTLDLNQHFFLLPDHAQSSFCCLGIWFYSFIKHKKISC